MSKLHRRLLGAAALALAATCALAQPGAVPGSAQPGAKSPARSADKPSWNQLNPAQRVALEPLRAEWDGMESVRRQKWLELANHYAQMKLEEQQRVHERMREWVRLTPEQRKLARQNYTQAKTISADEKSANWESYKQLPDAQKQKLAEQAARKQLTNLPPGKTARHGATAVLGKAAACPPGSSKNSVSATPACVASAPAATVQGAAPLAAPTAAPAASLAPVAGSAGGAAAATAAPVSAPAPAPAR